MTLPLILIAAVARNGAIGHRNALPWRLAGDMRHFRERTMGKPLIVGRRTWQSIGRPLPGRRLVVVSRDPSLAVPPGVVVCRTLDAALLEAGLWAAAMDTDAVMVGGGASLYRDLIGRADRLEITEVDLAPEADAVFPEIDPALWREESRLPQRAAQGDDADFTVVSYRRR